MMRKMVQVTALALAALLGAALLGAAVVGADEKMGFDHDLAQYFPIRAALAADKTDGVKERADELSRSADEAVKKVGKELAKAKDLAEARRLFGDLSKAVLAELDAAAKRGEKLPKVFVFDCSMTKPYGTWLQESKELGNPYQGSRMPRCGKLVRTLGSE